MTLTEMRIAKNYTQSSLATLLGVKQASVSKWERCKGMPRGKTLIKLVAILEVSEKEILECFKKEV